MSTDPKKGKGQPTQDQEKWNLRQRNNRTKTLQQTMPWMTRESWPRDQGEQAGPGEQEARVLTDNSVQRGSRASLHWSLLMRRHYILTETCIK